MKFLSTILSVFSVACAQLTEDEKAFAGTLQDFTAETTSTLFTYEYDAIVPPDGEFAMGGEWNWYSTEKGVNFISSALWVRAKQSNFLNGVQTTLYFQLEDNEPILDEEERLLAEDTTSFYEGCATTFTLKALNAELLSVTATYNMWGDHEITAANNNYYTNFNKAQSIATTADSVWRRGPAEKQTNEPSEIEDDPRFTQTVMNWRLVNNAANFKIRDNVAYYFKVGYRKYAAGNPAPATLQADTPMLSVNFAVESASHLYAGLAALTCAVAVLY